MGVSEPGLIELVMFGEQGCASHAARDDMSATDISSVFVKCFSDDGNDKPPGKANVGSTPYDADKVLDFCRGHLFPGRAQNILLVGARGKPGKFVIIFFYIRER